MLWFWLKTAGMIFIIAGSSGYGHSIAARYRQRVRELEQLRQMIFMLKGQILYANAPLAEGFEAVGKRMQGPLADLFCRVSERISTQQGESFERIWKEEVGRCPRKVLLMEKADMQSLSELGEHLGFMDANMQERNLLLYLEQLDLRIAQLREHQQERCRLYTSLGIMGGLFLAILLV